MRKLVFIFGAVILLLSGCGKDNFEAVAVDETKDKCDLCQMTVNDNAFATEIITKDNQVYKFDDLGCLFKWKNENKDEELGAEYVRDYDHKGWIELDKASYVYGSDIQTPMGYGVISFEKKADAETYVKDNNGTELLTAEELTDRTWESNMKKNHGSDAQSEQNGMSMGSGN